MGPFEDAGIPIHCLDVNSDWSPTIAQRLRSVLIEGQYDLIHTHSPFPSVVARVVAPRSTKAVVHTEHSLPRSRNWVTRSANRLTYARCDLVISVSEVVNSAVQSGFPRPQRSCVIYGGVDDDASSAISPESTVRIRAELSIPTDHLVVGNVAHLRSQKGLVTWLDTARKVIGKRPATSFVIVGREKDPGFQDMLEAHAEDLGISDNVRFAGFQPEPSSYLAAFDVFLMTSEFEGFPIALVEAMAAGIPVVATDVGGVGEALGTDSAGQMTAAGDTHGLALKVLALLDDEAARAGLAMRLRHRARAMFGVQRMVSDVENSYADLLGIRKTK